MLYQLSYASSRGTTNPRGRIYPSNPFQMSGTILKGTITVIWVQPQSIIPLTEWLIQESRV